MSEWYAVIFDLDDTLYPERDFVLSGFRAVAGWAKTALGLDEETSFSLLSKLFQEGVRGNTFDLWLAQHEIKDKKWVHRATAVYREHTPSIQPFSEVTPLLSALAGSHRLGLLSDGSVSIQQRKLSALQLTEVFDPVIFTHALGRDASKPSPIPFRVMLAKVGTIPARAVYVADNPKKDFCGPRALGMASIRVRHPGGLYSGLEPASEAYAPDVEVSTLSDLVSVLL